MELKHYNVTRDRRYAPKTTVLLATCVQCWASRYRTERSAGCAPCSGHTDTSESVCMGCPADAWLNAVSAIVPGVGKANFPYWQ